MHRTSLRCLVTFVAALAIATAALAGDSITPIYDIQYTTDPSGDSPLASQVVTLQGIVYATYPSQSFAVADATGAWNGIYVYSSPTAVAVGDAVTVTGKVKEYFNLTEIVFFDGTPVPGASVSVDSSGNTPYAPTVVTTISVATGSATSESYEGVFVEVQNILVTNDNLGYGEWQIDDGSGPTRVDDLGDYLCPPATAEFLSAVRGMLYYNFSDFKIEPRSDADLGTSSGTSVAVTIPTIQGTGFTSPHIGQVVETSGVVIGFFEGNIPGGGSFDTLVLQDPAGDGNPLTSDGISVTTSSLPTGITIGDMVTATGVVREYGEYDACGCTDDCATTILTPTLQVAGTGSVSTTTLAPPTDTDGQLEYFESLEGMRVQIDGDATVVGPTSFGTIFAVDADLGVDHVLRGSVNDGKPVGVRHWEQFGDIGGGDPPNLIVGSTISNIDGPLVTTFGDYVVTTQDGDAWSAVSSLPTPPTPPTWPAASGDQITLATFNTYNFDAGAATKLAKVVKGITALGCPTILALEEVDTASTIAGSEDDVLPSLIAALGIEGCPYASFNSHPDAGDHGVAVLWRTDQVTGVTSAADYQGCSTAGSSSSIAYDTFCDGLVGEYPLFSRRPVVVTATPTATCVDSSPAPITVIGAHFKSQLGGAPSDQRRLEQGQFVADLVDTLAVGGAVRVVVMGDLNDFEDSPTLDALTAVGPLDSAWTVVAAADRYSYNFNGISQIIDHILYLPGLQGAPTSALPLHFDADYPFSPFSTDPATVWKASDHDPMAATFAACLPTGLIFADGFSSGTTDAWSAAVP